MARRRVDFLVNARLQTLTSEFLDSLRPQGFLVPPMYATRTVRAALAALPAPHRREVLVDNGLFDDLTALRRRHEGTAAALHKALKTARINSASSPPRRSLPAILRQRLDRFAALLERESRSPQGFTLDQQRAFAPTSVIGAERICGSLWYSMGVEPSLLANAKRRFRAMNAAVISDSTNPARLDAVRDLEDLPVAAATDYATAVEAGHALATAGIRRFALPFGAFMADERATDSFVGAQGRVMLPSSMPVRVLRSALVAKGLMDGWHQQQPAPPDHVHLLGLGQPLILGIVAAAFEGVGYLTSDATSPFKDAASGQVYTSVPVFRRLRAAAIVWNGLNTPGFSWDCPCTWCRAAAPQQQWDEARAWFQRQQPVLQGPDDLQLKGRSEIARLLPYFRIDAPRDTFAARVGHNHWSLKESVSRLSRAAARRGGLSKLMQRWIDDYPTTERANPFHLALGAALSIASRP